MHCVGHAKGIESTSSSREYMHRDAPKLSTSTPKQWKLGTGRKSLARYTVTISEVRGSVWHFFRHIYDCYLSWEKNQAITANDSKDQSILVNQKFRIQNFFLRSSNSCSSSSACPTSVRLVVNPRARAKWLHFMARNVCQKEKALILHLQQMTLSSYARAQGTSKPKDQNA